MLTFYITRRVTSVKSAKNIRGKLFGTVGKTKNQPYGR